MLSHLEKIQEKILPFKNQIVNHKVYSAIKNIEDIQIFAKYHVYAVWDFMSLLKTLQMQLTCTTSPWFPKGNAETRYLINEIVVGEESDIDHEGKRTSHFELYIQAMQQCGANIHHINSFISSLQQKKSLKEAFNISNTPIAAQDFVNFTFEVINSNKAHLQAGVFTFGREDLIPNMFYSLIKDVHKHFPNNISIFKYYLERHIEVDGDHHSHLALQMTSNLCNDNDKYWEETTEMSILSLKKRIALWDAVYDEIIMSNKN